MHDQVRVGTPLEIAHPVNLFPLDKIARKHVLIAGGIGITPFLAQLEDLHDAAVPYELHYSVRSPEHAAFLSRLRAREGERVHMYYDSESQAVDFDGLTVAVVIHVNPLALAGAQAAQERRVLGRAHGIVQLVRHGGVVQILELGQKRRDADPARDQHVLARDLVEWKEVHRMRDLQRGPHPHLIVHEMRPPRDSSMRRTPIS